MMKLCVKSLKIIPLLFLLGQPAFALPQKYNNLNLTFEDNFNGNALDKRVWDPFYPNTVWTINNELQQYTETPISVLPNGTLRITGQDLGVGNKFPGSYKRYISGAITTRRSFSQTYGYYEISAKLPKGKGLWPAFWLLSTQGGWPPEIDVIEVLGDKMSRLYTTYHYKDGAKKKQSSKLTNLSVDMSQDYNRYGMSWRPGEIVYYFNDVEVHRFVSEKFVTNEPMYLLVNLAIGGGWPGSPDASTEFPAIFDVDYVRAYQFDDVPKIKPSFNLLDITSSVSLPEENEIITISGKLELGASIANTGYVNLRLYEYDGMVTNKSVGYAGYKLDNLTPNSTVNFSAKLKMPATLTNSVYYLSVEPKIGALNMNVPVALKFDYANNIGATTSKTYVTVNNTPTTTNSTNTPVTVNNTPTTTNSTSIPRMVDFVDYQVEKSNSAGGKKLNVKLNVQTNQLNGSIYLDAKLYQVVENGLTYVGWGSKKVVGLKFNDTKAVEFEIKSPGTIVPGNYVIRVATTVNGKTIFGSKDIMYKLD